MGSRRQIAAPQGEDVSATSSVVPFFNPTRVRCKVPDLRKDTGKQDQNKTAKVAEEVDVKSDVRDSEYVWSSRNNRKGRHAYIYHRYPQGHPSRQKTASWYLELRQTAKKMPLFVTSFPYWDISFLAAFLFTVGSVLFTLDGFFSYLPLVHPSTDFPGNDTYVSPLMVFFGATIFQVGGIAIVLEAFNENRSDCFGAALEKELEEKHDLGKEEVHRLTELHGCNHRHARKTSFWTRGKSQARRQLGHDGEERHFEWLPSLKELKMHYVHEMGFWASTILIVGASMFQVLGFLSLPYVQSHVSHKVELAFYDTPNVAGSVLFVVSSLLFMLETQPNWYTPAMDVAGWHVGFWNTIGSVGFLLSACFGLCSTDTCTRDADLSTLWGSIAFLIGSLFQWFEALDKNPIHYVDD